MKEKNPKKYSIAMCKHNIQEQGSIQRQTGNTPDVMSGEEHTYVIIIQRNSTVLLSSLHFGCMVE